VSEVDAGAILDSCVEDTVAANAPLAFVEREIVPIASERLSGGAGRSVGKRNRGVECPTAGGRAPFGAETIARPILVGIGVVVVDDHFATGMGELCDLCASAVSLRFRVATLGRWLERHEPCEKGDGSEAAYDCHGAMAEIPRRAPARRCGARLQRSVDDRCAHKVVIRHRGRGREPIPLSGTWQRACRSKAARSRVPGSDGCGMSPKVVDSCALRAVSARPAAPRTFRRGALASPGPRREARSAERLARRRGR
jgi:hypothetical protein